MTSNSLQQYLDVQEELYGRKGLVFEEGFVIYKKFEDDSLYIHLAYVEKGSRDLGVGSVMVDKLIEIEKPTTLYSYVDLTTKDPNLSIMVHLRYGFKVFSVSGNTVNFKKEINNKEEEEI